MKKYCKRGHLRTSDNLDTKSTCKECHALLKRTGRPRGSAPHPHGEASFKRLFQNYKHGASKRNLQFALSLEEFRDLTKSNCNYCGVEPVQIYKAWKGGPEKYSTPYIYNGVDRVDNLEGYISSNVVPCCKYCNQAKLNFSLEQFTAWLDRVVKFRKS